MLTTCRALLLTTALSLDVLTAGPTLAGSPPEQCYATCSTGRCYIKRGPTLESAQQVWAEPVFNWIMHPALHAEHAEAATALEDLQTRGECAPPAATQAGACVMESMTSKDFARFSLNVHAGGTWRTIFSTSDAEKARAMKQRFSVLGQCTTSSP